MSATLERPEKAPVQTRMVIANYLKGGIGNQLFQHVFAHSLARKLGADVVTDVGFFSADPYQNKSVLQHFAPEARLAQVSQMKGPGHYLLRDGVMSALSDQLNLPSDAQALVLDGYWQDERLLDPEVVKDTAAAIAASMGEVNASAVAVDICSQPNALAVHLRRRDYGHMGVCTPEYYLGAIDFIRQCHPDAKLFVFSDEPNYAQQLLSPRYPDLYMVQSGGDLADLHLMSLCRHVVISNSTYSWWAAYLAEAQGGTIVCPQEWVTQPGVKSPCPARWVQVPNAVKAMTVDAEAKQAVERHLHQTLKDRAIAQWLQDQGGQTLRLAFDGLGPDAVVVDVGAHQGEWAQQMLARYPARLFAFEANTERAAAIVGRLAGQDRVRVFNLAMGARTGLQRGLDGQLMEVRSALEVFASQGIEAIDVLKLRMGGGEFELLDMLADTGWLQRIKVVQVKFDDRVPAHLSARDRIVRKLAVSHRCAWRYPFVWEQWVRH